MPGPDRIEGLAIISADGMIADRHGVQPDALKLEADQRFFHAALDEATALTHGRFSGEGGEAMARRKRLIMTRTVPAIERVPDQRTAVLWNPAGATLDEAWEALGLSGGLLRVIGGTEPFGLFLERGYDLFHLSIAERATLPGGRPVFPGIPPDTATALLERHGLRCASTQMLDQAAGLSLQTWRKS